MKRNLNKNVAALAHPIAGAFCLVALLGASTAFAQQPAPASPSAPPKPAMHAASTENEQETPRPTRPGNQGIKVHGHWKIDVREKDGTFVKTIEFDNSLVTPNSADTVLSQMMAGQFALAGLYVQANTAAGVSSGGTAAGVCGNSGLGNNVGCAMIPGSLTNGLIAFNTCNLVACFVGLTQTYVPYNSSTAAAAYFRLQGSFNTASAGTITNVQTYIVGCATNSLSTVTNATCSVVDTSGPNYNGGSNSGNPAGTTFEDNVFTSATLPTPLALAAGQIVQVTVTISFS
jgi:hypothetical protein